ncbi:NOP5/NOP56 family protein [Methanobacterium sp. ACI-7]|uniref:NOP5/NOP56 family protein n=1 Tax=unclassified Methanobacterium TaxID=2627676 RepID=UPI0039C39683
MKCYLTGCFAGLILLDENFNLIDYELFPKDKIRKRIIEAGKGNLVPEEEPLLRRNVKKCNSIIIETNANVSKYKSLKGASKFQFENPSAAGDYLRSNLCRVLKETGFIESEAELNEELRRVSFDLTNYKIKEASKAEDMYLIQAVNSIDEIDESIGKLIERLREWYMIHFPELNKLKSNDKYVSLIAEYGDMETITQNESIEELGIENKNMGAEIGETDLQVVQEFAKSIKVLQDTKKSINNYIEEKMSKIAPNLSNLIGATLGAKLIAHIGSIEKLALLPSSTVQIMGAEKALFRHLKTGERPPKHGLIYQYPEIRSAKWWLKGKFARALAAKISLAVRKDVYSGEFDPTIKEDLEERLGEIKKVYPFPPRAGKSQKEDKKDKGKKKKKKRDKYKKKIKDYY